MLRTFDNWILGWLVLASALNFLLFAHDKLRAKASGGRIPEFWLVSLGAAGGWIGGLAAMLLFRHKTAKLSFQLKYAVALIIQLGWLLAYRHCR